MAATQLRALCSADQGDFALISDVIRS